MPIIPQLLKVTPPHFLHKTTTLGEKGECEKRRSGSKSGRDRKRREVSGRDGRQREAAADGRLSSAQAQTRQVADR